MGSPVIRMWLKCLVSEGGVTARGWPTNRSRPALAKQSAVDACGELSRLSIEGVMFRPTRPVVHEDGQLVEVVCADWPIVAAPVVQVHITTTLPGHVRAWGLHQRSTAGCSCLRIDPVRGVRWTPGPLRREGN